MAMASLGVACFGEVDAVGIGRARALLAAAASEVILRLPDAGTTASDCGRQAPCG
jgi:hypothetical protein